MDEAKAFDQLLNIKIPYDIPILVAKSNYYGNDEKYRKFTEYINSREWIDESNTMKDTSHGNQKYIDVANGIIGGYMRHQKCKLQGATNLNNYQNKVLGMLTKILEKLDR